MKILVTGATGFVGYHVMHCLLDKKFDIIASASSLEKAKSKDWFHRVSFIEHNMESVPVENLFLKFGQPDILIHLAWEGLPDYKNSFHVDKVLPAQYVFLENLIQNGLKNLTITGTCFEYGMKNGCLVETMMAEPANPYAIAKDNLRGEMEVLQTKFTFSLKWIRLFYMYGKGQSPSSLLSQLDLAMARGDKVFNMSGGQQVRDYLPVETAAANIVHIALQNKVDGIINCCSHSPVTIEKLVRDHIKKKGGNIQLNLGYYPYPDYEPMKFWGDNDKLKKALAEQ
ncbi:MAG: NAD(P)-dependent oxidoreductase [Bacteroidetes bacterium]|nr:NAD(P)-dependent oxidoreductase [Bacteroidota bacterium]